METLRTNIATPQGKTAHILLVCAITGATLWDFRIFDVRLFDAVSLVCMLGYLLVSWQPLDGWLRARSKYLFLFAVIIGYAALGYILHRHRSSIAIVVFAALGLHLVAHRGWILSAPIFKGLAIFHLAAFLIQYLSYMLFDRLLDLHAILGESSRILSGTLQFKPSGLFQEANSYCLNMYVLAVLAALYRPDRLLAGAAALSMMISGSLWGLGAAVAVIVFNELRIGGSVAARIRAIAISFAIVFAITNAHVWIETQPSRTPYLYARILNILNDPSARERYVINSPHAGASECTDCEQRSGLRIPRQIAWLTGEGLTTNYFLERLPANGIHFLLKSFGAIGLLLLFSGLAIALRGLPMADKFYMTATIGFAFTTYPLATYVIFWLWLPSLFVFVRHGEGGRFERVAN